MRTAIPGQNSGAKVSAPTRPSTSASRRAGSCTQAGSVNGTHAAVAVASAVGLGGNATATVHTGTEESYTVTISGPPGVTITGVTGTATSVVVTLQTPCH
jgi:hypothetical protein